MEKENEELKTRLENAEADCYTKKDEKTLNSIHTKLDEDKEVTEKIKEEKAKIEEGKKEVGQQFEFNPYFKVIQHAAQWSYGSFYFETN